MGVSTVWVSFEGFTACRHDYGGRLAEHVARKRDETFPIYDLRIHIKYFDQHAALIEVLLFRGCPRVFREF